MLRALIRLLLAVGGAAAAAVLVAMLEARAVFASLAEAASPDRPPVGALLLGELGVLFPAALGIGGAVGLAAIVLDPGEPTSPIARLAALREGPVLERLRFAAALPIAIFVAFGWCLGSAQAARSALAAGKPAEAGLTVGLASIGVLAVALAVGLACFPLVRRALALGSGTVPQLLDPALTTGVAVVLVGAIFALGIVLGDAGGEGGGVLGIFGVLKRGELDLRPVANAAVLATGAYVAPIAFGRSALADGRGHFRSTAVFAAAAAIGIVLALAVLCVNAARGLGDPESVAHGIDKHAPLGRVALAVLRKATDRDKDGYSTRFAGGDCNDADKAINPGAIDVPGNAVDEDCSGGDTPAVAEPVAQPADAAAKPAHKAFNVILITVDTLRPDLGFMGYPKPISPNMDKLAEKSTVFERGYSLASYTGKAVGPMLIGKYPSETHTNFSHFNTYYEDNVFVTERVHDAGARTFAGMCHFYFKLASGLRQGFDVWDTSALPPGMGDNDTSVSSERLADLALKLLANPENTSPSGAAAEAADAGAEPDEHAGVDAGDGGAAQANATEGPAGKFFAWFHFFDPHAQYVPHEGAPDFGPAKGGTTPTRVLYDQEVWFVDKHVGRILDYVAQQPWGENTAIIVTADHGEAFFEHGMSWHGSEIWQELVHVPLFVYVPGAEARRVPASRGHIDLAPTILDLMGAPIPEGDALRGKSLLADVYLAKDGQHDERDVYIDMPQGPFNSVRRAIVTSPSPGMKLIHSGGSNYQLFDLAEDPGEKKDLAKDKEKLQEVVARMQALRGRLKELPQNPTN